jgi:hypothetical protein
MSTLSHLAAKLQQSMTEANFAFVNTRVVLRTGVNLRNIRADHNDDPAVLERVRHVLAALGYEGVSES